MHTVQLLLKTSKYERHEIDRRFCALAHLHNVCVKHARKCMIRLQHDKRYAELRQLYNELVKKRKNVERREIAKEKNWQSKQLAVSNRDYRKLLWNTIQKVCEGVFSCFFSSQQVQA